MQIKNKIGIDIFLEYCNCIFNKYNTIVLKNIKMEYVCSYYFFMPWLN